MIKATIQRTPYCTEMTFPCTETQLSTWLDDLRMNPEHLCPAATITQIEPAELSILEDCKVSLDALNYLAKRMDGMSRTEQNQFFAALTCEELDIGWGSGIRIHQQKCIMGSAAELQERQCANAIRTVAWL